MNTQHAINLKTICDSFGCLLQLQIHLYTYIKSVDKQKVVIRIYEVVLNLVAID